MEMCYSHLNATLFRGLLAQVMLGPTPVAHPGTPEMPQPPLIAVADCSLVFFSLLLCSHVLFRLTYRH